MVIDDKYIFIYGKHAVAEALEFRPDVVLHLYLRDDQKNSFASDLQSKAKHRTIFSGDNVPPEVDKKAVHQGVIAKIDRYKLLQTYDDFREKLQVTPNTAVVILGELEDPHNVGAVIRSAAGFGLTAVLIPKHRQAGVTGTVVKVSAGMAFKIPLVEVGNVNRVVEDLKKKGFFVYGLDGEGDTSLHTEQFTKPTAFILGNEGEGLRAKTREHCDMVLSIPMHDQCESLNASASAAVTFYQWSAQHPDVLIKFA